MRSFLVFFISVSLLGCSQNPDFSDELLKEIKRRVHHEINPTISIALLKDSDIEYYHFYSIDNTVEISSDNSILFEIGSVTKTFTSTLAALHIQTEMDAQLDNVFPNIENNALSSISLSDIRNHKAG